MNYLILYETSVAWQVSVMPVAHSADDRTPLSAPRTLCWRPFTSQCTSHTVLSTVHLSVHLAHYADDRSPLSAPRSLCWRPFTSPCTAHAVLTTVHLSVHRARCADDRAPLSAPRTLCQRPCTFQCTAHTEALAHLSAPTARSVHCRQQNVPPPYSAYESLLSAQCATPQNGVVFLSTSGRGGRSDDGAAWGRSNEDTVRPLGPGITRLCSKSRAPTTSMNLSLYID